MKPELLAPAGSYDSLCAALAAGADAVYVGGSRFGARAYAENFDEDILCRAIDEVHLQEKKIYLTVNTLLKQQELEKELYSYLLPYYERGLDAVIVQDYGVFDAVKRWFPGLSVHCSTQMTITGAQGAKLLEELGADRIVTARELSLEEIRSIHETTNLEIESFVHGALCYCYSGQCLFSSMIGGRSGNRGRCAQPCRLPYQVYDRGILLNEKQNAYALSPKDMCTIELLPEILDAGVTSLKIEGRMKKPEYTAGVVGIYRKYLDLCLRDSKRYQVEREDLAELAAIYNRDGFNRSYYHVRNGKEMMAFCNAKNLGQEQMIRESRMREAVYARIREQYGNVKVKKKIKGSFTIFSEMPATLILEADDVIVALEKEGVQTARNQPLDADRIRMQLQKTGDSPFVFETLEVYAGEDIFVPMQFLNEMRREGLWLLQEKILEKYRRTENRTDHTDFLVKKEKSDRTDPLLHALANTYEQLEALLTVAGVDGIYLGAEIFDPKQFTKQCCESIRQVQQAGKKAYLALPHMYRKGELPWLDEVQDLVTKNGLSGILVRNLEEFAFLREYGLSEYAILDHNMYTLNRSAQDFWRRLGVKQDTASVELNEKELSGRVNAESEMIVYGYLPMMISAQCLKKNMDTCTKKHERLLMKDRYGKMFQVCCYCNSCYNVIYNSVPMVLLKEAEQIRALGMHALRLNFTCEDRERTLEVANAYAAVFKDQHRITLQGEYTKGHFKRGIE